MQIMMKSEGFLAKRLVKTDTSLNDSWCLSGFTLVAHMFLIVDSPLQFYKKNQTLCNSVYL